MDGAPERRHRSHLVVVLGEDRLRLAGDAVLEILRPRPLTRVPGGPPGLLGLINLRGAVIPVLSLAALMGRPLSAPPPTARIVAVQAGQALGLLVDHVAGLRETGDEAALDLDRLLARAFPRLRVRADAGRRSQQATAAASKAPTQAALALLTFSIGGQAYALRLADVAEVVALPEEHTRLPRADGAVRGLVEVRGAVLPLVSLRALLGFPEAETGSERIVVTRVAGALVGLIVDRVRSILRVPEADIDAVPTVLARGKGEARLDAIARCGDGLTSILSPDTLFDAATTAAILEHRREGEEGMGATGSTSQVSEQFVLFRLGEEEYALPIAAVDEVAQYPSSVTRVPKAPAFVEGVMNLRGTAVPLIDQRRRFGVTAEAAKTRRVVIVTVDGLRAGFVVDAVSEILRIGAEELAPAPELVEGEEAIFDRVVPVERDGRMILVIDARALLDKAERDVLSALVSASSAGAGT
ncbi:chemotaxis protein CheW [Rhodobacter sp. NSM]|uniref:chemotaxis protein CheW n=1 Tax=Rhodobacter sp. NSM TaxID=3457501 RepID=UPI003FD4F6C2